MSIIIFIIILGVLIFVHELGHFLVAKKTGIRVDEFAIGFPPRLFSFMKNGTRYALNLIPFGGYVKIFGETPDEESLDPQAHDSFVNKPRYTQAAVLVAGVLFNTLFAWLLISISLMSGFPSAVNETTTGNISDVQVVVTHVHEDSPAETAGLKVGDSIQVLTAGTETVDITEPNQIISFVDEHADETITVQYLRDTETLTAEVTPAEGVVEGRKIMGIAMDSIGIVKLPFFTAIGEGFLMTGEMIKEIVVGLGMFIGQAVTGNASFNDVAGPVGIVGLVGDASHFGLVYLLGFTAFISLNLAVLNLVPFPALDGGRLLFIAIEAITRKQIPTKFANIVNAIGFFILLLFMVVITISDIVKLF